ncbi:MAG: HIT family protein [Patescibacteria group bacterium]|jgi:histidine triad (HIT) family protein
MADCIFCKIATGEIPANKIHEDDDLLAFLDIMPVRPGHILVIPKKHFATVLETPDNLLSKMTTLSKKIGKKIIEELGADGINITSNTNPAAGQKVFHAHFHIIPRQENDGLQPWPQKSYNPGQAEDIAAKLTL